MQVKTQALKESDPGAARYLFYPLVVIVPEKHAVQNIQKVVLIVQRRQQLVPQTPEEFLPEPAGQRNDAFHQRARKIGTDQLRKDSMPEIAQQDRALVKGGRCRLQVHRRVPTTFCRTDNRKER